MKKLLTIVIVPFVLMQGHCSYSQDPYTQARFQMIEQQLKWRQIHQKEVLKAFEKIPRHLFVPKSLQAIAYSDRPLPIGEEQTISQPYIVALMTQELNLKPSDKVLEIGTGSGYQAAILSEIVKEVYTIEILPSLGKIAEKRLRDLGYKNIHVRVGDGYLGWPEVAPFDAIILTASPPKVPKPLTDQLKEGGHLIVPLGGEEQFQKLILYTKQKGIFKVLRNIAPVMFVPMKGKIETE